MCSRLVEIQAVTTAQVAEPQNGTEHEEEAAEVLAPRQRAPMVLDASATAVVKVLEYAEQTDPRK